MAGRVVGRAARRRRSCGRRSAPQTTLVLVDVRRPRCVRRLGRRARPRLLRGLWKPAWSWPIVAVRSWWRRRDARATLPVRAALPLERFATRAASVDDRIGLPSPRPASTGRCRRRRWPGSISSLGASDFVGIYTLEESLIELAPFTRDVNVLAAALDAARRHAVDHDGQSALHEAGPSRDSTGRRGADAAAMRASDGAAPGRTERQCAAGLQGRRSAARSRGCSQFPGRRAGSCIHAAIATPDVLPKLEGVVAIRQACSHVSFCCIGGGRAGIWPTKRPGRGALQRQQSHRARRAEELERRANIPRDGPDGRARTARPA